MVCSVELLQDVDAARLAFDTDGCSDRNVLGLPPQVSVLGIDDVPKLVRETTDMEYEPVVHALGLATVGVTIRGV